MSEKIVSPWVKRAQEAKLPLVDKTGAIKVWYGSCLAHTEIVSLDAYGHCPVCSVERDIWTDAQDIAYQPVRDRHAFASF